MIEQEAFQYLKSLEHLNLAQNKLRYISKSMFEKLDNLISLNLSDNDIDDIDSDSFVNLINLTYLGLMNTKANAQVDKINLENLKKLKTIEIEDKKKNILKEKAKINM